MVELVFISVTSVFVFVLAPMWTASKFAAIWIYDNLITTMMDGAAAAGKAMWKYIGSPIVTAAEWVFDNVICVACRAIADGIKWFCTHLWNCVTSVTNATSTAVCAVANFINDWFIQPIVNGVVSACTYVGDHCMKPFREKVLSPIWKGIYATFAAIFAAIGAVGTAVYAYVLVPIGSAIGAVMVTIGGALKAVLDAIGEALSMITSMFTSMLDSIFGESND